MTRRSMTLLVTLLSLTVAAGAWAEFVFANSRPNTQAVDCCLDPTCPPGCSAQCPPDCLSSTSVSAPAQTASNAACCAEEDCCAEARTSLVTATAAKKNYTCPPCPFCPGW